MAANKVGTIFVVTAGISIRGNLNTLYKQYAGDPGGPGCIFVEQCLSCIGSHPPPKEHVESLAAVLGLKPDAKSDGCKKLEEGDAPEGESGVERAKTHGSQETGGTEVSEDSEDCPDESALKRIVQHLDVNDGEYGARGLSAELSSLFADGAPHPESGDHIVLLASDSDYGLRCAALVGAILRSYVGGRLWCDGAGDSASPMNRLPCGGSAKSVSEADSLVDVFALSGVTVAVINGLRADRGNDVLKVGEPLARVLGSAYAATLRTSRRRLVLHPIGGYKATIPLFTALASHLPTKHGVEVEMWSNHELTTTGIPQPFLHNGLGDDEYWDLQELAHSGSDAVRLRTARWDGYAWRSTGGGTYKLTEVGRAILALRAASAGETVDMSAP